MELSELQKELATYAIKLYQKQLLSRRLDELHKNPPERILLKMLEEELKDINDLLKKLEAS